MAVRSTHIPAPVQDVWAVLADGDSYADWVVGAKNIRHEEVSWPQPGARIHHTVGVGPLKISDTTEVVSAEAPRRLELRARAWPTGEASVTFELAAEGEGTRVTMHEKPVRGPAARAHNPVAEWALSLRNAETLRRLRKLAVRRSPHR